MAFTIPEDMGFVLTMVCCTRMRRPIGPGQVFDQPNPNSLLAFEEGDRYMISVHIPKAMGLNEPGFGCDVWMQLGEAPTWERVIGN